MSFGIYEMEQPYTLLWAVWTIQQYAKHASRKACYEKYGQLLKDIMVYIQSGKHPNLFIHENGLVYANGRDQGITWMNSQSNGRPIVPRSGYIVEFNALWYNDLKFAMSRFEGDEAHAKDYERWDSIAEKAKYSFIDTFLNGYGYLYDYVNGSYTDLSVRPNMAIAIAMDYSPLDRHQRKAILDVVTKELLTPKGLRTLSPKSYGYSPFYLGSPEQREYSTTK